MVTRIKTWFVQGETYVEPRAAASYLGLHYLTLRHYITAGMLATVRVEMRQMITLGELKAYVKKRKIKAHKHR